MRTVRTSVVDSGTNTEPDEMAKTAANEEVSSATVTAAAMQAVPAEKIANFLVKIYELMQGVQNKGDLAEQVLTLMVGMLEVPGELMRAKVSKLQTLEGQSI